MRFCRYKYAKSAIHIKQKIRNKIIIVNKINNIVNKINKKPLTKNKCSYIMKLRISKKGS